jgi:hypothetical protein
LCHRRRSLSTQGPLLAEPSPACSVRTFAVLSSLLRQVDSTGSLTDCAPSLRCLRSSCSRTRLAGASLARAWRRRHLVAAAVGARRSCSRRCAVSLSQRTLVAAARFRHRRSQHPFAAARRFFVKSTAPARSRIARLRCVASVGAARGLGPLEHHWRAHRGAAISLPLQLEPVAPAVGAVQCAAVEAHTCRCSPGPACHCTFSLTSSLEEHARSCRCR